MIVNFNIEQLEKVEDAFHHDLYKLPFSIDNCGILSVKYYEVSNEYEWILGNIFDDVFVEKLKFYSSGYTNEVNLIRNQIELDEYLT